MNYFNYFTEIEDTFVRRRGKHLLLSPIDWAMIEGWQERGVPLHIVIRGIETVFDGFEKKSAPQRSIKGLLYCREEIEAQYAEWLDSQTGKDDEKLPADSNREMDDIESGIDNAIEMLSRSTGSELAEDIERCVERLRSLRADMTGDLEALDKSLSDIEKVLDLALLSKADKLHLTRLEAEIAVELKPYKKAMDADAYKSTFDLMLLKRLREDAGVPRLGLFYL
ncbi:MAG: hypothetical protein ACR2IH_13830 [Pyrinomonadaceae bacterium]